MPRTVGGEVSLVSGARALAVSGPAAIRMPWYATMPSARGENGIAER